MERLLKREPPAQARPAHSLWLKLYATLLHWQRNLRTRDMAPPSRLTPEGWNVNSPSLSADGSTLAVTDRDLLQTATTPVVIVFAHDGNGAWSQQSRIPATLYTYTPPLSGGRAYGSMVFSSDGNTLAVNTAKVPGQAACGAPASAARGAAAARRWPRPRCRGRWH